MKKTAFIMLAMMLALSAPAQSVKDLFSRDYPIVFYGLDLTRVKLVGKEFANAQQIRDVYFSQWNQILVEESKYSLEKPLRKKNVFPELSQATRRNLDVKPENLISYDPLFMTPEEVISIVAEYDFGNKNGIGLLFVVDVLDYTKQKSVVHIVFFSMATKKVMLYEMFRGKPGGVGIRNFWANSIADIIAQMESRYSYWEEVLYK